MGGIIRTQPASTLLPLFLSSPKAICRRLLVVIPEDLLLHLSFLLSSRRDLLLHLSLSLLLLLGLAQGFSPALIASISRGL